MLHSEVGKKMDFDKKAMAGLLNKALASEHQADLQYLTHASVLQGINCEPVVARLKEIAGDEEKHAGMLRERIAALGGEPTMAVAKTVFESDVQKVLRANLKGELEAIDLYRAIYKQVPREEMLLEHSVRHILMDELEHVEELRTLLGER